jgi:hypothetical protein
MKRILQLEDYHKIGELNKECKEGYVWFDDGKTRNSSEKFKKRRRKQ